MKKLLTLLLLFASIELGYAESFWTGAVNDGTGNSTPNVMNFDWAASGSGVAQGLATTPLTQGQKFTFRYQSKLTAMNAPDGTTLTTPGLDSGYEYTVVAQIPEEVVAALSTPPTNSAYFNTLPGGEFYIYNDTALPLATVASGSGFDDGTLVAKGTIDPGQLSTFFLNTSTGLGNGSIVFYGKVTYANPAFLIPANITGVRFEGTLNTPVFESAAGALFDGRAGQGNLATYTVTTDDLLFKVDGSSKFLPAPPPQGDCRVTAGGVKDGITIPCALRSNGLPDPKSCAVTGIDTWGGQAGAQPGVDGNWTHHHVVSPQQSFVFHSNSLFEIACSDPGCCAPACANAVNHQIDFAGIGSFSNQKGYTFPTNPLCFEVHLEDIGEPGPGGRWPSSTAPCDHCPGTPIIPGDCMNCTDYYELLIYDSAANSNGQCTGKVIYYNGPGVPGNCTTNPNVPKLFGYFTRTGNVQMHPENN